MYKAPTLWLKALNNTDIYIEIINVIKKGEKMFIY